MSNELVTGDSPVIMREQSAQSPITVNPCRILQIAVERGASMDQLEKLIALQERWEAGQARKAFDLAVAAAKAEIKPIVKSAEVDFTSQKGRTNYKHETLDGIAMHIDPVLSRHGLSYRYRSTQENGGLTVTCIVAHRDGHSEETTLSGPPDNSGNKNAYQAVGSAATYLQRYTLKLALGLSAAKDDDGHGAEAAQPAAPATISREQAQNLVQAAKAAGKDADYILSVAKINRLSELPVSRFQGAMKHIQELAATKQAADEKLSGYEVASVAACVEGIFGSNPESQPADEWDAATDARDAQLRGEQQ